jgi:hypothetical protein
MYPKAYYLICQSLCRGRLRFIELRQKDRLLLAMVDTGAEINVMGKAAARCFNGELTTGKKSSFIRGVNHTRSRIGKWKAIPFYLTSGEKLTSPLYAERQTEGMTLESTAPIQTLTKTMVNIVRERKSNTQTQIKS